MKRCTKCGVEQALDQFYRAKGTRDGLRGDCRTCFQKRAAVRYRAKDYDRMLETQGGGCAICGRPPREDISLHVDHDHETGRIRGILCWPCNNLLGDVHDEPARLYAAADYLARDPELDELIRQRARSLALTGPGR